MLLFLIVFNFLLAGPCGFSRFPTLYPAERVTACLKTIPSSTNELNSYLDTILQHVKNSPYQFLFRAAPDDFPSFNIESELENLRNEIPKYTQGSYLSFYESVYKIIFKLRDAHAQVTFPFLSSFLYLLPFTTTSVPNSLNFEHPSFKLIPHTTNKEITDHYIKDLHGGNLTDKIYTHIDLNGSGVFLPAYEVISAFARETDYSGYDPHAQYNSILNLGFSVWSASRMFRPDEIYNPKVKMQQRDDDGNITDSFEMDWLGVYSGDNSVSDWNVLSPLHGSISASVASAINASSSSSSLSSLSFSSSSSLSSFTPLSSSSPPPPPSSVSSSSSSSSSSSTSFFSSFLSFFIRPFRSFLFRHKESTKDKHAHERVVLPPLEQVLPLPILEHEQMLKALRGPNYTKREEKYTSMVIKSDLEKMLRERRHSNSTKLSRILADDPLPKVTLTQLFGSEDDSTHIYVDEVNKIGVVRYHSFSQQGAEDFLTKFGKGYREMVDKDVKDVILDLRGNGGGYIFIAEVLIDFFFHDTIYPCDFDFDYVKNNLNSEVAKQVQYGTVIYKLGTMDTVKDFYNAGTVTKIHKDLVTDPRNPDFTFQADYTSRFVFNQRIKNAKILSEAFGNGVEQFSPFTAEHFYIVTNGACYSCCGIVTKQAIEMKAARVLGYGKSPDSNDIKTYAPGSCAGSLMTSTSIDSLRGGLLGTLLGIDASKLPRKFPRDGAVIGYTDIEFFSRNPEHVNDTLYFVNASVQDILPFATSCLDGSKENLEEMASIIKELYIKHPERCFPGEVHIDDICSNDPAAVEAHQLWGFPCEQGVFDTTKCAFAFCTNDSFLAGKSTDAATGAVTVTCTRIPEGRTPNELPPRGLSTGIIILIVVLCVVLLPLIVIGVIIYCCCCRKKGESGSGK